MSFAAVHRSPSEVLDFLSRKSIHYQLIHNPPVYTCIEAARARHVPLHNELKTLLIVYGKYFALLNLPGDMRVNSRSVRHILLSHNFRLANVEELKKLRLSLGLISPLSIIGCRSLIDRAVLKLDWITTNAGSLTLGLRINVQELLTACNFEVGSFAEDMKG